LKLPPLISLVTSRSSTWNIGSGSAPAGTMRSRAASASWRSARSSGWRWRAYSSTPASERPRSAGGVGCARAGVAPSQRAQASATASARGRPALRAALITGLRTK